MRLPSQSALFWQSHCATSAENHRRMAELQRQAGLTRLAAASEQTARERDLAAEEMRAKNIALARALDRGEKAWA